MRQKCAIVLDPSGFVFSWSREPALRASIRRRAKIVAASRTKTAGTQPPAPGILKIKKQIRHSQQHAISHDQCIDRALGRAQRRKQDQQSDESGHAQHVPRRVRMRSCEAGQPASHEASIIAILQLKEWTRAEHPHANSDRPADGMHAWERNK